MNLTFLSKCPKSTGSLIWASLFLGLGLSAVSGSSPKLHPVQWQLSGASQPVAPGSTIVVHLHADVTAGYHLYSLTTPAGGPIATTISIENSVAVTGPQVYQPTPNRHNDPNLNVPVETFSGLTDFPILLKVNKDADSGAATIVAQTHYQACSEEICLPPVNRTAMATINIQKGLPVTTTAVPTVYQLVTGGKADATSSNGMPLDFRFLLLAFGFGLAAVFTPCVFPTLPLTISYFLNNQQSSRYAAIRQALLFAAGIIVLFSATGLLVTLIAGPFGVIQLAGSPWINGIIAIVFIALALSLLGAFELTLPSSLLTRLDGVSQKGGIVGGLMLGLTSCLTSFACVGPFLGTLLAASVQHSIWQPVFGMIAFASGLATPFFLLSLFPAFLNRLPRSGAWLRRVKVVFGFLIMAVAIKYLASVDQVLQLHILTRERFIAVWFSLFLSAALYLWGQLKLIHSQEKPEVGLGRLLAGAALLAFAISLLPGLWGGRLGELESFIPPAESNASIGTQASSVAAESTWLKNDYDGALAQAKREHKPLLISFSGYACTNCHWMKANLFPRPEIQGALRKFVLLELYTDGTDSVSSKNQDLEQTRFSTVALPYYAVLDEQGNKLSDQAGLTRNPRTFLAFLNKGLSSFPSTFIQAASL